MKKTQVLLLMLLVSCLWANGQSFNPALADSLGADEYGMKSYVLVMLKTGSSDISEKAVVDSLFKGHMLNITDLVEKGKLTVAGPLGKNDKNYRGIFILNVPTVEEGYELIQSDPAIAAKLLEAELYKWYGSAALPLYLPEHNKIQKTAF